MFVWDPSLCVFTNISVSLQHVGSADLISICFWRVSGFLCRGGWILRLSRWRRGHRWRATRHSAARRRGGWWALAVSLPAVPVCWRGFRGGAGVSARGAGRGLGWVGWRRNRAAVAWGTATVGGACYTCWCWFTSWRILRVSSACIYSLHTPTSFQWNYALSCGHGS